MVKVDQGGNIDQWAMLIERGDVDQGAILISGHVDQGGNVDQRGHFCYRWWSLTIAIFTHVCSTA